MKQLIILIAIICSTGVTACSQSVNKNSGKVIGGGCEGCQAVYESPVDPEKLPSEIYLPDYNETGPKIMVEGTIYKRDGKTPAPGVVLYIYHTDQTGHYPQKGGETGWGKRHGYIRGWLKSDEKGRYKFYTLKPASYPGRKDPAHIHPAIKEPGKNEYWIDEYLFDDDPLLTAEQRKREERGGNGILKLEIKNGILCAKRDIILGLNVPDYE